MSTVKIAPVSNRQLVLRPSMIAGKVINSAAMLGMVTFSLSLVGSLFRAGVAVLVEVTVTLGSGNSLVACGCGFKTPAVVVVVVVPSLTAFGTLSRFVVLPTEPVAPSGAVVVSFPLAAHKG